MKYIKPRKLKAGDTVAIISPSWGGPSIFPHVYEYGIRVLKENFDLKIKEYPTAKMSDTELYNNPKLRAKDINDAFADKKVKAIFATIGGDDGIRVLKYLNINTIKKNPKIFMGYSDTSVFNMYLNKMGITTFNGPSIMAGFAQMENFPDCIKHVKDILFSNSKDLEFRTFKEWAMEYLDWTDPKNLSKPLLKNQNDGWHWIQGNEKVVSGELFGGCIEIMAMMRGTKYWPKPEFFKDKIVFLETSEDKPTPEYVKRELRNWGAQGIFDHTKALLIGRARGYTKDETQKLEEHAKNIINNEFGHPEIPIITNMDFGHTDPQNVLPLGTKVEIDCKRKIIRFKESSVK